MKHIEHSEQKPSFVYVNFHSSPKIKTKVGKTDRYKGAFDFLFLLTEHFNITVFDFIGINTSFEKQGVKFHYKKKKSNSKWRLPFFLFLRLRKLKPSIVYVQGLGYPHFIYIMKLFLKQDTRIIVHDHANRIPSSSLKRFFFKKTDPLINYYLFSSKLLAQPWLNLGLIASDNKVIECVEGSTSFRYSSEIKKDKNTFMWVGRLDDNKDPMTIVKAFSGYIKTNTKATLQMFYVENLLENELYDFILKNDLQERIILKGALPNHELELWYQRSTYFILGSHKEGGPFSLIEAMACGCIPIVTSIPAFHAMTNSGTCGFLFEPGNEKHLLDILLQLDASSFEEKRDKVLYQFENELSHSSIALRIKRAALS